MRRTLTVISLVTALIAVILPVGAKPFGDLYNFLFGGTRQYTRPGITISLTGVVRSTQVKNPAFDHQPINTEEAMVSKGSVVDIDVLVLANRIDGREFVIGISDRSQIVKSPSLKGRLPNSPLGGMFNLGRFSGPYGYAPWDTGSATLGYHYLYVFVKKGGEYQPQGEMGIPIWVGPSLEEIREGGINNLSSEDLKANGLETVQCPAPATPAPKREEPKPVVKHPVCDSGQAIDLPPALVDLTLVIIDQRDKQRTKTYRMLVQVPSDCDIYRGQTVSFKMNGDIVGQGCVTAKLIKRVIEVRLDYLNVKSLELVESVYLGGDS